MFIGPTFTFTIGSLYYRANASLCSLNPVYEAEGNFFSLPKQHVLVNRLGFPILAFPLATPSQAGGSRGIGDIV